MVSREWEGGERELPIEVEGAALEGTLVLPKGAKGLVLFAHGSGSSRHSPRSRYVAEVLYSQGIGTLLFDLLTAARNIKRSRANCSRMVRPAFQI